MTVSAVGAPDDAQKQYQNRIRAWMLYDWANSAFATTILAAVLPVYFSSVAGATLASRAVATSYWAYGLSFSLILTAVLAPILGTVSDIMRGKKLFLSIFMGIGALGTAALVFVGTGDWVLASAAAIIGRIGFTGSIAFYDSLLPHVANEQDRDRVSAGGFAAGYLGGGILLAINIAMIQLWPGDDPTAGARYSFLSVAIWWVVFSIPLFLIVPEPRTAVEQLKPGENIIKASFARIGDTLKDIAKYGELVKFVIAFLIYNDAISTIIGMATIYGTELGFETTSLILALLLVQFVGMPFSLIFGNIPNPLSKWRGAFVTFVVLNLVCVPLAGILGMMFLPDTMTGRLINNQTEGTFVGQGLHNVETMQLDGAWAQTTLPAATLGTERDVTYASTSDTAAAMNFPFNGQNVILTYAKGPDQGVWAVLVDNQPLTRTETTDGVAQSVPVTLDAYNDTVRYGETMRFLVPTVGQHTLTLVAAGTRNEASTGDGLSVAQVEVQTVVTPTQLPIILGGLFGLQAVLALIAFTVGRAWGVPLANLLDTQRAILLALVIYAVISIWGFFLSSAIEYWYLAWMVAVVQGGSQALSRSLFSSLSPASKSGEFFGLFGVLERFSSFIGPLIFAVAAATFGSSRPAILSLIIFFIVGGGLLLTVNVAKGREVAQEEDRQAGLAPAGD
jgi:MFS transporter, UMF1 family